MNRNEFVKTASSNNVVKLQDEFEYRVVKVNDTNLDISAQLKSQLIEEGLYDNSYIGVIVPKGLVKINMNYLPVYGSKSSYVTKHFKQTIELAIRSDLSDRKLGLLKRAI